MSRLLPWRSLRQGQKRTFGSVICLKAIVFLWLLLPQLLPAQQSDSLLREILQIPNDTERVNQLYKRGYSLRNSQSALSAQYAMLCEEQALGSRSDKHLAKSYNLLGILHYKKGDYRKALHYHKEALKLRRRIKDITGIAHSNTNLGNVYSDLEFFELAETHYLDALRSYEATGNMDLIAASLLNLGTLKQLQNLTDPAEEYYRTALRLGEKQNDYELRTLCLNNLADVCFARKEFERAIGYNFDALKLAELMDNSNEKADSYLSLSWSNLKLGRRENARQYVDTAYAIGKREDYFEVTHEACRLYAGLFAADQNYKEAYQWQTRYYAMSDSVYAVKEKERIALNFGEYGLSADETGKTMNNLWLVALLVLFSIVVPVFLFRYKR